MKKYILEIAVSAGLMLVTLGFVWFINTGGPEESAVKQAQLKVLQAQAQLRSAQDLPDMPDIGTVNEHLVQALSTCGFDVTIVVESVDYVTQEATTTFWEGVATGPFTGFRGCVPDLIKAIPMAISEISISNQRIAFKYRVYGLLKPKFKLAGATQ